MPVMLLPIIGFVFAAYLVIGFAIPVVPLFVRNDLGLNNFVVGLVAGSPFVAALLSRLPAGRYTDGHGSKRAILTGLACAAAGGVCFIVSVGLQQTAIAAVTVLLAGRALLGVADSFVITGSLSWGLRLIGTQNTGRVMSFVGTALYAAFAIGAPAGTALYARFGFNAIALATIAIPIVAAAALIPLRIEWTRSQSEPSSIVHVARAVWQPGVALALSGVGVGFGAITAFVTLFFVDRGWAPVWPAFTLLSAAFMVGRFFFGSLADRAGGARVACVCIAVETAGLLLTWSAPSMAVALAGVTLSGFGYSLVYPGLGVEAIRSAPVQSRGVTMGAYTAFLDLSLGISGPLLGLVAGLYDISAVFLVSALAALISIALTLRLWARERANRSARCAGTT